MKTRRIVIFGSGQIAELADFYFTNDSDYEVAAFTVDQAFLSQDEFRGRPVVPFERVAEEFSPQDFGFFVAIGYTKLNGLRPEKVAAARAKGYRLVSYLSSRATVFAGFELQENCFILEDNTIQRSKTTYSFRRTSSFPEGSGSARAVSSVSTRRSGIT
jgi:hypothetical protein